MRGARTSSVAKLRTFATLSYGAKGWNKQRRIAARIEATRNGLDIRYVVTSLKGTAKHLYESVYCGRGQAENFIKWHKAQLASDRHLVPRSKGQPVPADSAHRRLLAPTRLRGLGAQDLVLARRPIRHPPSGLR